jgi:hypothetical protein
VFPDQKQAEMQGRQLKELAIFDLGSKKEIRLQNAQDTSSRVHFILPRDIEADEAIEMLKKFRGGKVSNDLQQRLDRMSNSGTSAGVAASWNIRRGGMAKTPYDDAFHSAQLASIAANSPHDPTKKLELHRIAFEAHKRARDEAEKNQDGPNYDYHNIMASSHSIKSKMIVPTVLGNEAKPLNDKLQNQLTPPDTTRQQEKPATGAPQTAGEILTQPDDKVTNRSQPVTHPVYGVIDDIQVNVNETPEQLAQLERQRTDEILSNRRHPADYNAKLAEKEVQQASKTIDNDAGGDSGASGVSSGPPASGPNVQGPNGRLGALSSSPILKGYGTGAQQKSEFSEKKKKLANALKDSAKANNGWLPNFKYPTKKEVELAKRKLPNAKVGLMKHGAKHVVKLDNGISKGKSVEFTFNEKRNPNKMAKDAEWVNPFYVDPESADIDPSFLD